MSRIVDVSGKLGEYMLKGWVLTDNSCPTVGCNVPLMRSPTGKLPVTHFCANCDGDPRPQNNGPPPLAIPQSPSVSSSSHISRASTPPTEISSTLSSPTFAPPAETQESIRRRQQSNTASAEIGKRLLKGWAMLGDECPNSRCFGVPLVRPPKAGGGKDPRKECVICGTVYVDQRAQDGWERLVPMEPEPKTNGSHVAFTSRDKGKAIDRDDTPQASKFSLPTSLPGALKSAAQPIPEISSSPSFPSSSTASALDASGRALELSLRTLSQRLTFLSSNEILDPASIASTADAILKVGLALNQIKQMQWSENRAFDFRHV